MVDKKSSILKDKIFKNKKNFDLKNINFRKALVGFMVLIILSLGFTGYKINEIKTRAFQVYLGEDSIGVVRSEEVAKNIMEDIRKELSNTYEAECILDKDLAFETTHVKDNMLISESDLRASIQSNIDFVVAGYSINIDGEEVGAVKTEKEAQLILDAIKEPYVKDTKGEIQEVKILENVQISKKEVQLNSISESSELVEFIKIGTEEIKTHIVEDGENFWVIAKKHDTSVDELLNANPDRDPKKLKPGDEVKLLVPTSKLTVATTEKVEYVEDTDYEVVVETDASMYTNQKKVKVEGKKGQSKIVANEVKHNGILVEKEVINEEVIEKPVNELVVKGTKEVPRTVATGILMMPTRGRVSSNYGSRWGRMHRGMDIAAKTGTPIYAADGGKVTISGYKGALGNMVEIDHGNGVKTRYGHASKLIVKAGTKVYKGQHIANVGNTGNSTGPHLHIEVIVNGVYKNPRSYLK